MGERPPWLALLAPLPAGALPRRGPGGLADWRSIMLDLSAGPAGLRVVQVLVDGRGELLSASDHVLLRTPGDAPVWVRQESLGGRFNDDATFGGTHWVVEGPEPAGDEPPDWTMTPRSPTEAEVAALRVLVAEVLARAAGMEGNA